VSHGRDVVAVIPARMASQRFPGKVAFLHKEKPLLFYVWDRVRRASLVNRTVVASDDRDVLGLARDFGADTFKTSGRPRTGSDRVAEVAAKLPGAIFINVQADTFGLPPALLDRAIAWMKRSPKELFATLARRVTDRDELANPNTVKMVVSAERYALWFSRSQIPYIRGAEETNRMAAFPFLKHIGVYVFRRAGLEAFAGWKPAPTEKAESLEQLRILHHGGRIRVFETKAKVISIDSIQDVQLLEAKR